VPISVFDLFSVGIGPSSSHTVGPMRAARAFVDALESDGQLTEVQRIRVELFGSLGATGRGHGADNAILLGLLGERPETVDTATVVPRAAAIRTSGQINLLGRRNIAFGDGDLVLHRRQSLPYHPNGLRFTVWGAGDRLLRERTYYSVGGGFVVDEHAATQDRIKVDDTVLPYPFTTGDELLKRCAESGLPISGVMLVNETSWRNHDQVHAQLVRIWEVMEQSITEGWTNEGVLPGGLKVPRRAPALYRKLVAEPLEGGDPLVAMDWVNLFALAVNEENAAGGRIVTAPTNGAAGIIPAVLSYYVNFGEGASEEQVVRFLLTAGAIGLLYRENASVSGAEVGCQGEVGAACSMAAAALCEVLGGTPHQVENAAEIAMEHNLGLTCDPVGGLVQIPCIERNAMAAVKAINAARIALRGDGEHLVSLDTVIRTMRETGADMKGKYKETARGGLAVNVIEC